jgi:hypothetical protein
LKNKSFLTLGITVILLLTLVVLSAYAAEVITVDIPPHLVANRVINLDSGDKFTGSVSIFGGTGDLAGQIACFVDDPAGQGIEIFAHGIVKWGGSFEFTANKSGAYTFYFANPDTQGSRTVTLSYDVVGPSFFSWFIGSGYFWAVIGLIILVFALAGLRVGLTRRRRTSNAQPPPSSPPPPP